MAQEIDDAIEVMVKYLNTIPEFGERVRIGEPPSVMGQTGGVFLGSAALSNFGSSSCMETHDVTMRVYIPLKEMKDVEAKLKEAWKDVRNMLFAHQTLDGNSHQALPIAYTTGYQDVSGVHCRIMSITVRVGLRPIVTFAA